MAVRCRRETRGEWGDNLMATGHDSSDARLASDPRGASAQPRAVAAYLLIAESAQASAGDRLSAAGKIVVIGFRRLLSRRDDWRQWRRGTPR